MIMQVSSQNEKVILGLLDLANAYCETDLKTRCQHLIRQSVSVDNVASLYATGMKYEALVIIVATFLFVFLFIN